MFHDFISRSYKVNFLCIAICSIYTEENYLQIYHLKKLVEAFLIQLVLQDSSIHFVLKMYLVLNINFGFLIHSVLDSFSITNFSHG